MAARKPDDHEAVLALLDECRGRGERLNMKAIAREVGVFPNSVRHLCQTRRPKLWEAYSKFWKRVGKRTR